MSADDDDVRVKVEYNSKRFLCSISPPTLQAFKEALYSEKLLPLSVNPVIKWDWHDETIEVTSDKAFQMAIDEQRKSGRPPKFFLSTPDQEQQQLAVETTASSLSQLAITTDTHLITGSSRDDVIVELLTSINGNITHLREEVHSVHALVERKTVQKDGSKATGGEYSKFFGFTSYDNMGWLLPATLTNAGIRASAAVLISAHQAVMRDKEERQLCDEVRHVQPESKELLEKLTELFLPSARVKILAERSYSCRLTNAQLESIVYNGKTDAVIMSTRANFVALCWEVKNLNSALSESEIAQTAAEVSGELEYMLDKFDIKPPRYAAVLTSGVAFLFVMAKLINGKFCWRHSAVITDPDVAAAMMEGTFYVVQELLALLDDSVNNSFLGEQPKKDADDGDKGGDEDEESSKGGRGNYKRTGPFRNNFIRSIRTTLHGGIKKSSNNNSKGKKHDLGLATTSDDYRYAPLTMANLDLFNKMRANIFSF